MGEKNSRELAAKTLSNPIPFHYSSKSSNSSAESVERTLALELDVPVFRVGDRLPDGGFFVPGPAPAVEGTDESAVSVWPEGFSVVWAGNGGS